MDQDNLQLTLEKKGYTVSLFSDTEQASNYLCEQIREKTVGFGDSMTLLSMGLYEKFSLNNTVWDPQQCTENSDFIETAKKCLTTEIFLTSVNAISETGELVCLDGTGNRVAGSAFGHEKVYFVVGTNKVVPTLEDAIFRTRNVAAPQNAQRLQLKTPCAKNGDKCYDCSAPERICNAMMIYLRKMNDMDVEIILIDESLGL